MNIAIVDDDEQEIEAFSSVIKEYAMAAGVEIGIAAFHSAEEFLENYRLLVYTAIFMDIYMTGMTGVEAARKILEADRHAIIIFLTSSDSHMGDALSLHAYDYIEKPADRERIFKVMDDVLMRKTELDNTPRLAFTSDRQEYYIPYPDIMFIRTVERNYLEIRENPGKSYRARLPLAGVQEQLSVDRRVFTITRGVIVNMDFIRSLEEGVCILEDGTRFPISSNVAGSFSNLWQNYKLDSYRNDRRRRRKA